MFISHKNNIIQDIRPDEWMCRRMTKGQTKKEYWEWLTTITDEEGVVTFDIHYGGKIFTSLSAYEDGASPIGGFNGKFEMDKGGTKKQYNIIKQCYLHLKEQEGFSDGTDC